MPPPDERSRPPAANRGSGPKVDAHASEFDSEMVRHADDGLQGNTSERRLPVAFASQAAPCEGRTQYGLMYRCPVCSGTHFGRSPVQLVTGKRVARCGRVVWLVIARNYTSPGQGAAG